MKIRSDYVSNSSSSSFIIRKNAPKAVRMFIDDFQGFLMEAWNDPLGESMNIGYKLKGQNEDWFEYDNPGNFCHRTEDDFSLDDETDDQKQKLDIDSIEEIQFECDDYDHTGTLYLRFLYEYFKKFGFNPDDSDTEHEFRDGSCLLGKLLDRINCKEENKDEDKK